MHSLVITVINFKNKTLSLWNCALRRVAARNYITTQLNDFGEVIWKHQMDESHLNKSTDK